MNCFACERNLSAYLDDELSNEERREIEGHLEQCDRCRVEFDTHQLTWEIAGGLQAGLAPDGLWRGIEQQMQTARQSTSPNSSLDELALMIKGLATEVQEMRRTVDALRDKVYRAEGSEGELPGRDFEGIRVRSAPFATGTPREGSIDQVRSIEELRRSS